MTKPDDLSLREAELDIEVLRAKAWRLCEAIAMETAVRGSGWKAQMDAEAELLVALKELRTACDGRPR